MKVACPGCHSVYGVKDDAVPPDGIKAACPKCGGEIFIQREPTGIIDPDQDYSRTMILFMPLPPQQDEQAREISAGLAGLRNAPAPGKRFYLKVAEGDEPGREYPLEKPRTVIGRGRADILLEDPEASRRHASVDLYGETVVIRDLGSTNGTFVNRLGVKTAYLKAGDEVLVGNTVFTLLVR